MRVIEFLKIKIRIIKKSLIVRFETKKMGGKEERKKLRTERVKVITDKKETTKKDLLHSWRINEIKKPDKEDWDSINLPAGQIPISFLIRMNKKYWGENI